MLINPDNKFKQNDTSHGGSWWYISFTSVGSVGYCRKIGDFFVIFKAAILNYTQKYYNLQSK